MGSQTAAGSSLAISATGPATHDAAGYAALTFTDIGQVEKLGSFGASYAKAEFQPLKGAKQKYKGSADNGAIQPSIAIDSADAGQALLQVAAADESQKLYSFCVTYPDGAKRCFRGRVFGSPETADGADSMLMSTPTIEISTRVVKVPVGAFVPAPVLWNSTVNFVVHGNSFVAGIGATTGNFLGDQIKALAPFAGSGASSAVIGRSGYSWGQLNGDAAAIDATFVPGKINILLVGETTNSVFNDPQRSAAQTIAAAKLYVTNRLAANAWDRIVIYGTIPRQDVNRTPATTLTSNPILDAVDADMKANISAYGAYAFIDVRTGTPFALADYNDTTFAQAGVAQYYSEAPPGEVHPNNAGYGILAAKISAYLKTMPIPTSVTPVLGTLTLSGSIKSGTASTGTINGATSGSTIASNVSGLTVNSAARTYSWDGTGAAATTANGLVETLSGATGSPKPSPLTVDAAGSTTNFIRMTTITKMTETVNGSGYNYVALNPTAGGYSGSYAYSSKVLPANADGWFASRVGPPGAGGALLALCTTATPTGYASTNICIFADSGLAGSNGYTGTEYAVFSAGNVIDRSVLFNIVQIADGDVLRSRRTGTSAIVEVSKDGGATFIPVYSRTVSATVPLTPFIQSQNGGATGTFTQPFASANVA